MTRRGALLFLAVLVSSAGCDHAAKQVAERTLSNSAAISLAFDSVRFELVHNPGAFLSLGENLPAALRQVLFVAAVPVMLVLVCGFFLRFGPASPSSLVALGLMAGGGLANWLDRILHAGAVTDFVSLGIGPLRTGIFNLADVFVLAGAGALVLSDLGRVGSGRPRRGGAGDQTADREI